MIGSSVDALFAPESAFGSQSGFPGTDEADLAPLPFSSGTAESDFGLIIAAGTASGSCP